MGGGLGGGLYGVKIVIAVPRPNEGVGSILHFLVRGVSESLVMPDGIVLERDQHDGWCRSSDLGACLPTSRVVSSSSDTSPRKV